MEEHLQEEEEGNAYEKEREKRIMRNQAVLEELQLARMVNELAAPMLAAANAEKQRQEKKRAAVEAVTPRRHSTRPSAQQTRKLLAKQAQQASEDIEEDEEEDRLLSSGEDAADSEGPPRFKRGRAEEDDYDPVADMSEQEEGSVEEATELDVEADQISADEGQAEAVYKRPRNSKASATRAGGSGKVSLDRAPFPVGDSSDEDAELQQAIAMSLMEARPEVAQTDQGHPNLHAAPRERSTPGTVGQKGTASALAPMSPDPQEEAGAAEQGAANKGNTKRNGRGRVGDESVQQEVPKGKARAEKRGGGRRRAPAHLDASHENVQSAFAMLAGSKGAITANSLNRAWDEVRGGELPEGCMEHMLTYAAEVTGSNSLTASAFKQLVAALNC